MHLEVETISVNSVHCASLFILQLIDQHVGKGRTIDATDLWHRSQFGTYVYIWPTMSIIVIDIDNPGWYFFTVASFLTIILCLQSPDECNVVAAPRDRRLYPVHVGERNVALSMWEKEMWPWFEREAGQKASLLWLVPTKRDMPPSSRSIDRSICLVSISFH
jgi:hypothetical protein